MDDELEQDDIESTALVDETPRLYFDAFLKIYDPETQETFVEQRD